MKIFLKSNLVINGDAAGLPIFTMKQCTIKCAPGVSIRVSKVSASIPAELKCTKSFFFGCEGSWEGVRVTGGKMQFSQNEMEDAMLGLSFVSTALNYYYKIEGNVFNRDIKAMLFTNVAFNGSISGNTIKADGAVANFGTLSDYAIEVQKSTVTFGSPNAPAVLANANTIKNYRIGVFLDQSSVTISYMNINTPPTNFTGNTIGIKADRSNLTLLGYYQSNAPLSALIQNYQFGVYADRTTLRINRASIVNCLRWGIWSWGNSGSEYLNLSNNFITVGGLEPPYINSSIGGIYLQKSNSNAAIQYPNFYVISGNQILLKKPFQRGIYVDGFAAGLIELSIKDNTVFSEGSYNRGIELNIQGSNKYNLVGNKFLTSPYVPLPGDPTFDNLERWGFYFHDATAPDGYTVFLGSNIAQPKDNSTAIEESMCAYHILSVPSGIYCENTSNFSLRGFHFGKNCNETRFSSNTIGFHSTHGLLIDRYGEPTVPATIGGQIRTKNIWLDNDYGMGFGAKLSHDDDKEFNPFTLLLSETIPNPIAPSSGWFSKADGELNTCKGRSIISTLDDALVKNTLPPMSEVGAWATKMQFMDKFLRNSDLLEEDQLVKSYFLANLNTSAGRFAQHNKMFTDAMKLPTMTEISIGNLHATLDTTLNNLWALDSVIETQTNPTNLQKTQRQTLINKIQDFTAQLDQAQSAAKQTIANNMVPVLANNATLPASTVYEANQKSVNEILISEILNGGITSAQKTILLGIAAQCPSSAGITWERAVSRLPLGLQFQYQRENPIVCLPQARPASHFANTFINMEVFPNPANEMLNLRFGTMVNGTVQLTDIAGKVMVSVKVTDAIGQDIGIGHLTQGIYTCTFLPEGGVPQSKLFVKYQD